MCVMEPIKLRPHHLLDIVTGFEPDRDLDYRPAPGENGMRTVRRMLTAGTDFPVQLVIGPDFICAPCSHLRPDGKCDRILQAHKPPQPMDDYNDPLDACILAYLGLEAGAVMSARDFLEMVNRRLPGIEEVCTHPTQQKAQRLAGLLKGMEALGIRPTARPAT